MIVFEEDGKKNYLDYYMSNNQVEVKIFKWVNISKSASQYIIPSRSFKLLFNYVRKIGVVEVVRKVRSRMSESGRNSKFLSFGIGTVVASKSENFKEDDLVVFVANNHPRCVDVLSLPESLLDHISQIDINDTELHYYEVDELDEIKEDVMSLSGWSSFSGTDLDIEAVKRVINWNKEKIKNLAAKEVYKVNSLASYKKQEKIDAHIDSGESRCKGVLYGYGQYAKTMIIPNFVKGIDIVKIHEVDPLQIGVVDADENKFTTNPYSGSYDNIDFYIAAGFHHTHAAHAINALEKGAYVIIEKPIVTTETQYENLKKFFNSGKIFSGFHKRYMKYNKFIRKDLRMNSKEPISYFCVVFEIPLPANHWYNWPNSGSRIVSNGCHWVDHFMFLNDYSAVETYDLILSKTGDYLVYLELENGAVAHITLTDKGSSRIGVREHIEIRSNNGHVRITDSKFVSEYDHSVVRNYNFHPYHAHRIMYNEMSKKIINKEKGDAVNSFRSSEVMLKIEKLYQQRNFKKDPVVH